MSLPVPSDPRTVHHAPSAPDFHEVGRKMLVACGIIYPAIYVVANDLIAATIYEGYDRASQVVSELSSTGAASRPFLMALTPVFNLLLIAFGAGVMRSARGRRGLGVVGVALIAQGLTAFLWALGPMSQREAITTSGGSWRDDLHLVLSALSVLFIVAQMAGGARSFGRAFNVYAVASIVVFLAAGAGTGVQSVALAAGEPTPWLGVIERVMLGAWLLWMAVLSILLLRHARASHGRRRARRGTGP